MREEAKQMEDFAAMERKHQQTLRDLDLTKV